MRLHILLMMITDEDNCGDDGKNDDRNCESSLVAIILMVFIQIN